VSMPDRVRLADEIAICVRLAARKTCAEVREGSEGPRADRCSSNLMFCFRFPTFTRRSYPWLPDCLFHRFGLKTPVGRSPSSSMTPSIASRHTRGASPPPAVLRQRPVDPRVERRERSERPSGRRLVLSSDDPLIESEKTREQKVAKIAKKESRQCFKRRLCSVLVGTRVENGESCCHFSTSSRSSRSSVRRY
jgi:hypothetical protein